MVQRLYHLSRGQMMWVSPPVKCTDPKAEKAVYLSTDQRRVSSVGLERKLYLLSSNRKMTWRTQRLIAQ